MRAVIQRVKKASVKVDENIVGKIDNGFTVLLGVEKEDTQKDMEYIAEKTLNLRVFEDDAGKMNLSLMDVGGSILAISQFTLYGDCRKGRRPGFDRAAPPDMAQELYNQFIEKCRGAGVNVETGIFRADMLVEIHNDGPVTILLDSKRDF